MMLLGVCVGGLVCLRFCRRVLTSRPEFVALPVEAGAAMTRASGGRPSGGRGTREGRSICTGFISTDRHLSSAGRIRCSPVRLPMSTD